MATNRRWQATPTKLTTEQFEEFALLLLSRGQRGPAPTLSLDRIFNYIMQALSWIGVIEPRMIGVMRPSGMAPKRDFEGS